MITSRLKTIYKHEAPESRLTGADYRKLDPVFAGRLAFAAKDNGINLHLTEAYRSPERQAELYRQYQQYLKTGQGSIKLAAKPGTSRHEYRLAIDTSTQPIRGMANDQLAKYGLCKPIKSEPWHIEPIELMGLNITQIKDRYLPEEVEELTEAEVRKLVKEMIAESDPIYKTSKDVPDWARASINKLIKEKVIAPNPDGSINLPHSMVRILAMMDRRLG